MAHKRLSELRDMVSTRATPYSDSITVTVVKKGHIARFTDSNGQQGELLNFSIADCTGTMLATLTDKTKQQKIVEGKTLMIRNFILKGGKVAMSTKTTIMGRPKLEIPQAIIDSAVQLIMPPSPEKKVAEVKTADLKSIFSVKGQIIKNEATRTVKVNGNDTSIRTITLEENGATVDVTLWRELSQKDLSIGDFLQISHCLLNEWQGVRTLNTTRNTTIEKIQPLEVTLTGTVEALSLAETCWEVCVQEYSKQGYRDITIEKDMFKNAFGEEIRDMAEMDMENFLIEKIPFKIEAVMLGSRLLSVDIALPQNILPCEQDPLPIEDMELIL